MACVERRSHLGQLLARTRIHEEALDQSRHGAGRDQRPKCANRVGGSTEPYQAADKTHHRRWPQDEARDVGEDRTQPKAREVASNWFSIAQTGTHNMPTSRGTT